MFVPPNGALQRDVGGNQGPGVLYGIRCSWREARGLPGGWSGVTQVCGGKMEKGSSEKKGRSPYLKNAYSAEKKAGSPFPLWFHIYGFPTPSIYRQKVS